MSAGVRTFGALVAHDGVTLVEYRGERTGLRIVNTWTDGTRSVSIDEALVRVGGLVEKIGIKRARVALAIEQFGVFHHVMTLPPAADEVLAPVVKREVQRVFGVADPVVAFTRGAAQERREPARADERTAPRQLFVAGAPRETIDALAARLESKDFHIEIATVVPKAMHSLYSATGGSLEPTAVLVCLESGPHLAFFLDGRLELAIDPPIALEGDRPTVGMILDQVERGAVYFRQQFRGAEATRILLAARPDESEALATALEARLGAKVAPLFPGATSPEAVIAMGAVLESHAAKPLDLFPHPPTTSDRVAAAVRGPNGIVAAIAAAAVIAIAWSGMQIVSLSAAKRENTALRSRITTELPTVTPMRDVAERRADVASQLLFVRGGAVERDEIASTMAAVARNAALAVSFDSVHVARAQAGWSGSVVGKARGATTAQAVNALDTFLKSVRAVAGVSTATLDDFDYASATPGDTTHTVATAGPVVIQFRISFAFQPAGGKR